MQLRRPTPGPLSVWRSVALPGIAVLFLSTFSTQAQDVAEAARQEQARKAAQKNPSRHVYTEEDLKKERILTPEDQAKVEAKKQQEQALAEERAKEQSPAEEAETESQSLGEIARRYRWEKAEREAAEAARKNYTPFTYELAHPAAASLKPGIGPIPEPHVNQPHVNLPSLGLPAIAPPGVPRNIPMPGIGRARVSPFQPRPLLAPPPVLRVNPAPVSPAIATVPRPAPPAPRDVDRGARRELRTVKVEPGESWWKLADRYLGSGSRWPELRSLNPEIGGAPDRLRFGATVRVPEGNSVQADSSTARRASMVRVKPGDTLWKLAREHFGRGSAWACLAGLNPQIVDYRRLAVGTAVHLPDGGVPASGCANAGIAPRN